MAELCGEVEPLLSRLHETFAALAAAQAELRTAGADRRAGELRQAQRLLQQQSADLLGDLTFVSPVEWHPDYGRASLPGLLAACQAALAAARANYDQPDPPYRGSPYIAVWGFYLGGLYDLMNAAILARNRIHLANDALRAAGWALAQQPLLENEEIR
jgi:hypothetical protein